MAYAGNPTGDHPLHRGVSLKVAVADVDEDQQLEMFFGDGSGSLVCLKANGTKCWSREVGGETGVGLYPSGDASCFLLPAAPCRSLGKGRRCGGFLDRSWSFVVVRHGLVTALFLRSAMSRGL